MTHMHIVNFDRTARIEQLKACAETIIKNAESIIGDEHYAGDMSISIILKADAIPSIKVDKDIYPDRLEEICNIK